MAHCFEIVYGTKVSLTDNHNDQNKKFSSFIKLISLISY